jgi:hypothetical protein
LPKYRLTTHNALLPAQLQPTLLLLMLLPLRPYIIEPCIYYLMQRLVLEHVDLLAQLP